MWRALSLSLSLSLPLSLSLSLSLSQYILTLTRTLRPLQKYAHSSPSHLLKFSAILQTWNKIRIHETH